MSVLYTIPLSLPDNDTTTIVNNIQVGTGTIRFRFQWAVASEEQYNIVMDYINTKTKSDPMDNNGVYSYDYDYVAYYMGLSGRTDEQLNNWLDTDPILPHSIRIASRPSQLLMLHKRIAECETLDPVIKQYKEVLRWQFQATYKGQITTGFIEPGGWYRNQDPELCFRFVSELPYIGRNDFNNVTIEFEVGNE